MLGPLNYNKQKFLSFEEEEAENNRYISSTFIPRRSGALYRG